MGISTGCSVDLSGKVAIVTGCNTGIGLKTAKMLCDAGAHVVMACRSKDRAKSALNEVTQKGGEAEIMTLDLSDTSTIVSFAKEFLKKHPTLDILINNAGLNTTGGYEGPTTTKQGYEICMGTNYFGHFLLTNLLMKALLRSEDARVVQLSSVTTWFASDKYQYFVKGASKTKGNYATSKLACLAFTSTAQSKVDSKYPSNTIRFVAADPGFVASDVWRNSNAAFRTVARALALNTEEGAMTSVNCASLKTIEKGQLYMPFSIKMSKLFRFSKKIAYDLGMPFLTRICHGFGVDATAPKAKSKDANEKLWSLSLAFCEENGEAETTFAAL
jgi:NAD(P)-dependent dehydrogenase (short-subunit alcohol dehydrogenase family)